MAKKKKLPKRPRQTASTSTWENYERKVKEVKAHNARIDAEEKKKDSLSRKFADLKAKHRIGKVKTPRKSASLQTWQNAYARLTEHLKKIKQAEADKKAKESLQKKFADLKRKHSIKMKAPRKSAALASWKSAWSKLQEQAKDKAKKKAIINRVS